VGRFLGPNIEGHYSLHPLAAIVEYWKAAGMEDVHAKPMSLGGGLVMWPPRGVVAKSVEDRRFTRLVSAARGVTCARSSTRPIPRGTSPTSCSAR